MMLDGKQAALLKFLRRRQRAAKLTAEQAATFERLEDAAASSCSPPSPAGAGLSAASLADVPAKKAAAAPAASGPTIPAAPRVDYLAGSAARTREKRDASGAPKGAAAAELAALPSETSWEKTKRQRAERWAGRMTGGAGKTGVVSLSRISTKRPAEAGAEPVDASADDPPVAPARNLAKDTKGMGFNSSGGFAVKKLRREIVGKPALEVDVFIRMGAAAPTTARGRRMAGLQRLRPLLQPAQVLRVHCQPCCPTLLLCLECGS